MPTCFWISLDDGAHLHAELRVQIGQRLVHQQDVRLDDQRTRQRDALLLAAGEAIRHTVGIFIHMDKLQGIYPLQPASLPWTSSYTSGRTRHFSGPDIFGKIA